jgi:phosphate transport system permease protein
MEAGAAGLKAPNLKKQWTPRRAGETAIKGLLFAAAVLSIATTTGIVVALLRETIDFFREVPFHEYAFGDKWTPLSGGDQQSFGVLPLIFSTLYLTGIGLVVAVPLGLGCAIWLAEYASPRARRIVKPTIEVLAGIPTIVFGYFALTFVTPEILQGFFGAEVKTFNALSAGIVLGLLVLPTIASLADDALVAVPGSLREGAFGLGATKRQVSLRVVTPAAISGIVAQNMAAFIANTARSDVSSSSAEYLTIFAVGTTLFLMTLVLNMISIGFVRRYRQVYE